MVVQWLTIVFLFLMRVMINMKILQFVTAVWCKLKTYQFLNFKTRYVQPVLNKRGGKNVWGESSPLPQMPLLFGCLLLEPGHVSTPVNRSNPDLLQQLQAWNGIILLVQLMLYTQYCPNSLGIQLLFTWSLLLGIFTLCYTAMVIRRKWWKEWGMTYSMTKRGWQRHYMYSFHASVLWLLLDLFVLVNHCTN